MKTKLTLKTAKVISIAWAPFLQKLSQTLSNLLEDQYLIISKKGTNEFIQFAGQGTWGMRIETISNYYRCETSQLDEQQVASLISIGWHLPTGILENSTPADDPDGSPNFYAEFLLPLNHTEMVRMTVQTFTDVLNVSHPANLEYEAFNSSGDSISLPDLGLSPAITSSEKNSKLPKLLGDTIKELTGIDLTFDSVCEVGEIRYGNIHTCIMLNKDRPCIRFVSVLLENAKPTLQLLARINEFNSENGFLHLFHEGGDVIAVCDILVAPYIASHVAQGLEVFTKTADEMFTELQAEFGEGAPFCNEPSNKVRH